MTFGSYTRRIYVNGTITTWPRPVNISSVVQGVVVKRFIKEYQDIKKGDTIYQIDISKSTRAGVVNENQSKDIEKSCLKLTIL